MGRRVRSGESGSGERGPRWRLGDLRVRTKLLLLAGLPIAQSLVLLLAVGWGQHVWSTAYTEALHWREHAALASTIKWAASAYIDGVSDLFLSREGHHADEAALARRELEQATAASLRLAERFSLREQQQERELAVLVGRFLAEGAAVGESASRMVKLRSLYEGPLIGMMARRIAEEEEGSLQALRRAEVIGRWVLIGGIGGSVCVLLLVILACLHVARGFTRSISELRAHARQVAGGNVEARLGTKTGDEFGELAGSLAHMTEALREQRRNQYGFLAAVAHDLRNPLTVLRVAADALKASTSDEASLRKTVALLRRQVDRMNRMTEDLLDAAKIEAGELELKVSILDLRLVAGEVADSCAATSAMHSIHLSLPEEPLLVRCDPARIAQVLHNLLSNAIKYSPRGGRVELGVGSRGDLALVSVTDHGVGIDPHELEAIFAPFHRGATGADVPGTGLGLAICRRIVTAHGGTISVQSERGRGTSFEVALPCGQT